MTAQLTSVFVFDPLLLIESSSLYPSSVATCCCTARFVSDLVGNPEDSFSRELAHIISLQKAPCLRSVRAVPACETTGRGFGQ